MFHHTVTYVTYSTTLWIYITYMCKILGMRQSVKSQYRLLAHLKMYHGMMYHGNNNDNVTASNLY